MVITIQIGKWIMLMLGELPFQSVATISHQTVLIKIYFLNYIICFSLYNFLLQIVHLWVCLLKLVQVFHSLLLQMLHEEHKKKLDEIKKIQSKTNEIKERETALWAKLYDIDKKSKDI